MDQQKVIRTRFWLMSGMVLLAAATRLVTPTLGLYNFHPIGALALFGGCCFASPVAALTVPLAAMALSDVGLYALYGYAPSWPVYACFALLVAVGFRLRRQRTKAMIIGTTAVSSVVFFVVTNSAMWLLSPNVSLPGSCPAGFFEKVAWAFSPSAASVYGYPKTLEGYITCMIAGIPFFPNTLMGDAFFMFALFGAWALVEKRLEARKPALAAA
jgi:hypothetical protein